MSAKISIIMPSLNVVKYIDECIQSVLNQTYTNLEIICVDAGSTDGTVEVLKTYADKDSRVQVVHSDVRSYGYQMNLGISHATGEYIGIVETDDFVSGDMYEKLIHAAEEYDLDYVKSDFKGFVTLANGCNMYINNQMFVGDKQFYNKIIVPGEHVNVYLRDFNIWKGIYKKSFLVDNGIAFNETPGAAFQDLGFVLLTITCAERAMYLEDFGYRYRMDRGESSSNNPKGIRYAYNEFVRLIDDILVNNVVMGKRASGVYYRMCVAYVGELDKWIRAYGYSKDLKEAADICNWFEDNIHNALKSGIVEIDRLGDIGVRLIKLLADRVAYIEYLEAADENIRKREEQLIADIGLRNVIIFGAGAYGCKALELFDRKSIVVKAYCDNGESKWGTKVSGFKVFSPRDVIITYPDACYVIANKNHSEDIKKQLLEFGIQNSQIVVY